MFLKIKTIQLLLLLNENLKFIFLSIVFFNLFFISSLLGFWQVVLGYYHLLIFILFTLFPILYFLKSIKNIRIPKRNKAIFWLEKKNYENINPISSLLDKPAEKNYDKVKWDIHKKQSYQISKKIIYYYPRLNFDLVDPLKIRILLFFFLLLSLFWSIKNEVFKNNLLSVIDFQINNSNENSILSSIAWVAPPSYTQLGQREIRLDNLYSEEVKNIEVPINSELKINITSKSKDLKLNMNKKKIYFSSIEDENYEILESIGENKSITILDGKKVVKKLYFSVISDQPPEINFLSNPEVFNSTSIKFLSKATDDYRVSKVSVIIEKPSEFRHFINNEIYYELPLENLRNQNLVKNYFYKNLENHIWAGYNTKIVVVAFDDLNQKREIANKIVIPERKFSTLSAKKIYSLRKSIALKKVTLLEARNTLNKISKEYNILNQNLIIDRKFSSILKVISELESPPLDYNNYLYEELWNLVNLLEDGSSFLVKRQIEQIEQNLYDSIKKKNTDRISLQKKSLKDKIDNLIDMRSQSEYPNDLQEIFNETLKDEIEEVINEIEDLLNSGSKEKLDQKMQELKDLSESLKNPRKIDEKKLIEQQRKKDVINKLSKLLNEQEKIMEESFNMAADRGKFKQSSEGSGGRSPREKQDSLRNTLGNIMREISSSENEIPQELGRADRAMRQASRELENGKPDRASNAQGRAMEMIQRSLNKMNSDMSRNNVEMTNLENKDNNKEQNLSFSKRNNIENDGNLIGGVLDINTRSKERESKKIVKELYSRYNEKKKNEKERNYIKKLLDWY